MTAQVQSPELLSKLAAWRAKAQDGTLTLEEMREAVKIMRQNRHAALDASTKSTSKKPKGPTKSAAELLKDLENF